MNVTVQNGHGDLSAAAGSDRDLAQTKEAVFVASTDVPSETMIVKGIDFNTNPSLDDLLASFLTTGFQATNVGLAIKEIEKMIKDRNGEFTLDEHSNECFNYPEKRRKTGCTIFLGYTSNLISSGLRETLCFLVQHNQVDCLVTSAGGVEEDLIKCLAPTFVGDFAWKGADMRKRGHNRIGNLFVPNDNYCKFEDFLMPILDKCLEEQNSATNAISWTPSKLIHRLGKEIDNRESVCYWAYKNDIPIFCPALTDGSLGDMLYFHSYRNGGLKLDIVEDIRFLNDMAVKSVRSGMIILGGGIVKHHIANANLMRNGAEYSVFLNTGQEFDGSDSGARPDEAVSWGKIKPTATPVKCCCDATVAFPLIVSQTFAKNVHANKAK